MELLTIYMWWYFTVNRTLVNLAFLSIYPLKNLRNIVWNAVKLYINCSFMCTTKWVFRWHFWLNLLSQTLQEYGFSPVWISMCRFTFPAFSKILLQIGHVLRGSLFEKSWPHGWLSIIKFVLNELLPNIMELTLASETEICVRLILLSLYFLQWFQFIRSANTFIIWY